MTHAYLKPSISKTKFTIFPSASATISQVNGTIQLPKIESWDSTKDLLLDHVIKHKALMI